MIILSVLLGLGLYLLGKRLFGTEAGLCALFLYALCPNILAHAPLISHDVGLGTMMILTALFCWDYFQTGKFISLFYAGIFLGFCMVSKFTSLFLGPAILFWFLFREIAFRGTPIPNFLPPFQPGKHSPGLIHFARVPIELGLLLLIAAMVLLSFYQFRIEALLWGIENVLHHQGLGCPAFLLGKYSDRTGGITSP